MEIGIEFFAGNTVAVAQEILGKKMTFGGCSGIVVETEAYRDDPASHGIRKSERARILRETYGRIYVYVSYGIHLCLNITAEKHGVGAVLIRAVEPVEGVALMKQRRKTENLLQLTSGPGKLCQAFGMTMDLFGKPIGQELKFFDAVESPPVVKTRRVGISRAKELDWRFLIRGSRFVSRPAFSGRP